MSPLRSANPSSDVQAVARLLTQSSVDCASGFDERLLALADAHGVTPLLANRFLHDDVRVALPAATRDRLVAARRQAAVLDSVGRAHAGRVCDSLAAAGIDAIVFKGAALAETHYAASWLRPRGDVDLLVPAAQAGAAGALLEQYGCRRLPRPEGRTVTYQSRYVATVAGTDVTYDLHWRVADPQAFTGVLDHDALSRDAVPGPWRGARMAGPVDALLIACVHRAAHHFDTDRLLLLCDIERLASRFTDDEWACLAARAESARLRAVCFRGLDLAARLLGSPFPLPVRARLEVGWDGEPTAAYVGGAVTRKVDVLRSDLERLPSWRARLGLVREHLFPSPTYMSARYGMTRVSPVLLPVLYLDRMVRGLTGWFRPVR